MSALAFKVVQTRRPYSNKTIGVRLVLAIPNKAQYNRNTGEMEQSFAGRFRVAESGDYTVVPPKEVIEAFIGEVSQWFHITRIIPYE